MILNKIFKSSKHDNKVTSRINYLSYTDCVLGLISSGNFNKNYRIWSNRPGLEKNVKVSNKGTTFNRIIIIIA